MTISELKRSLDAEIERLDIPNMLRDFMTLLLRNEEEWLSEDESRISKLVTDFFLKTAFQDFANRTITKFLRDKYQEKTKCPIEDGELSEFIYNDWMLPLTKNAHPLFDCDNNIWSKSDTGQLSFLSYPQTSAPIKTAAEKMHLGGWDLKESALTDRIFVMSSACGIPLSAYNKCPEYEQMLFSARTPGRHYYEGNPVSGQDFNNYYKIPVYQAYLSFQALDSERRSDIRREYQKVADTGGERLQESGKRMKAEISLTKLKGWNKQAESDTYHDKYDEIYSFLEKFQKSFQTFCELYDIG